MSRGRCLFENETKDTFRAFDRSSRSAILSTIATSSFVWDFIAGYSPSPARRRSSNGKRLGLDNLWWSFVQCGSKTRLPFYRLAGHGSFHCHAFPRTNLRWQSAVFFRSIQQACLPRKRHECHGLLSWPIAQQAGHVKKGLTHDYRRVPCFMTLKSLHHLTDNVEVDVEAVSKMVTTISQRTKRSGALTSLFNQ